MNIKNDDYVVVFRLPSSESFKSYFTDCEIILNENDVVAVYEETCTIAYGNGVYRINWDRYMNMVKFLSIEEMTYIEYLQKHREYILKYNYDSPVILTINENLNPGSQNKVINLHGINVQIQRY